MENTSTDIVTSFKNNDLTTSLSFSPEAIDAMSVHMEMIANSMVKKAEDYCRDAERTEISENDVLRAFKTIGSGLIGTIHYHTIASEFLPSGEREILVYLPPSYFDKRGKSYPVIYMHDGQNLFDKTTGFMGKEWFVNEKVEYLIKKHVIEEVIIVGINNGQQDRLDEYTWNPMEGQGGGKGKLYGEFLTKEVKPFIDEIYKTRPDRENTAVIGSSLGGLISFYLALHYPEVFSKIGMMSPSLWWNNCEAISDAKLISDDHHFNFWIGAGTAESDDMMDEVLNLKNILEEKCGTEGVIQFTDPNATHSEEAWAHRVHGPIIQFFGLQADYHSRREILERLMDFSEWSNL